MRLSLKTIFVLWVGIFLIIGGLLFNAYSKLNPESLVKLVSEQVHKNYPGTEVYIDDISYGFVLDFVLGLKNVRLKKGDNVLAQIGELEMRFPWWLLISGKGHAQINLEEFSIFLDHSGNIQGYKDKKQTNSEEKSVAIELPIYLSEAKYTLRASKISFVDIPSGKKIFKLSKLLVRDFHYGKNSAFELNAPITIKRENYKFTSEVWLFGEITPDVADWKLNYRGEFKTKDVGDKFQIEDIILGGVASFDPSQMHFSSDVNLSIEKKPVAAGRLNADRDNLNFNLTIFSLPLSYLELFKEEIKNPYLVKPDGSAAGWLKFNRSFDSSQISFQGKLNFDGVFKTTEEESIPGKWQVGFQDSRWEISFMSPKGEASYFKRSVVDFYKDRVSQYVEELGFSDMNISSILGPIAELGKIIKQTPTSFYSTTISYKRCFDDKIQYDGQFYFGFNPEKKFFKGEIHSDESSFDVNYSSAEKNELDIKFKNFKWNSYLKLFNPFLGADSGSFDGKIEGRWSDQWDDGKWLVSLDIINPMNMSGIWAKFLSDTLDKFEINEDNFKKYQFKMMFQNKRLNILDLLIEDPDFRKISGELGVSKKSFLQLTYPKNRKKAPLKKEITDNYWLPKENI